MSAQSKEIPSLLTLKSPVPDEYAYLLNHDALRFIGGLVEQFGPRLNQLLKARKQRQKRFDAGKVPGFEKSTTSIRNSDFQIAEIPREVLDRRTEITGPVNRKMVINALNSGAQVYMADLEDSTSPSWENLLDAQHNLYDAVRRQIDFSTATGKAYQLKDKTAVLMVRPRGLHLPEAHVLIDGSPIPACLFDYGLYLYHNHIALKKHDSRPYFYLPKLEHYREAEWWADVIRYSELALNIAPGTVRVTVLIETLPAVFQMNEILYYLRDYILGLNCGRWDYIFSYIKVFQQHPDKVLPDREQVGMTAPFLAAYSKLLIETCHRHGAFAMGGMAAQIPIKNDAEANRVALGKVKADKQREARNGHDGTWVAHPALEPLARAEFDAVLYGPNQIRTPEQQSIEAAELLEAPTGSITEAGVTGNIQVAIQYLHAWINGQGCVPINHLMEDAATAEIARAQLWQWRTHHAQTDDQKLIDEAYLHTCFNSVIDKLQSQLSTEQHASLHQAAEILRWLVFAEKLEDFLTLPAYRELVKAQAH